MHRRLYEREHEASSHLFRAKGVVLRASCLYASLSWLWLGSDKGTRRGSGTTEIAPNELPLPTTGTVQPGRALGACVVPEPRRDMGKIPCPWRNCDEHPRPAPALLGLTPGSTRDNHDSIATGNRSKATNVACQGVFRRGRKQPGGGRQPGSLTDASRRGETASRETNSEALDRAIYTHSSSSKRQIPTRLADCMR
ncbi:hypothetical protein ACCO45_001462 [Purpureocillium lilacinum]|uniref:Uncharacterized protein n=1 Tax=Purpureocillium lilacinum TaxID=33203 RepID=A0ACC4E8C1_PURLI